MTFSVFLLALLLSWPPWARTMILGSLMSQIADAITIVVAIEDGRAREGNPLLSNHPGVILGIKGAVAGISTVLLWREVTRKPKTVFIISAGMIGVSVWMAKRNQELGRNDD